MSTITYPPHTPTTTSHPRSRPATGVSPQSTRSLHAPAHQQSLSFAPASQESTASNGSVRSSVVQRLQTSSSDVSQLTDCTDLTSPASSRPSYEDYGNTLLEVGRGDTLLRTPEGLQEGASALASPMSITSPAEHGTKRTASGHVKNAPSTSFSPTITMPRSGRSRAESLSSNGSRAGELAASLKMRLGYAMVKVQHGLEHKTFAEVERTVVPKASPNRYSMTDFDYVRRPVSSGLSNGTARMSMYSPETHPPLDGTFSPPSKRHSASYTSLGPGFTKQSPSCYPSPRLQPAPELRPTNGNGTHPHRHPAQSTPYTTSMSPPRTPNTRPQRPRPLRTDTQTAEAERDALQALFQLGSPHTSQISRAQNNSQASSSQASPLRMEFPTPRRVTFARSESRESSDGVGSSECGGLEEARVRASEAIEGR